MTNLQALLLTFAVLVLAYVVSTKEVNIAIDIAPYWNVQWD